MKKYCLIIDNDNQSNEIETIERRGKVKVLDIECLQFNVGSPQRPDLLTDNRIDIDKVISVFQEEFKGITFDLLAFDWDYSDENIDGIELIRHFQHNKIRRSTPKLLYSGLLKDEINNLLAKFKNEEITDKQLLDKFNTLIKVDIKDFVDRTDYENTIVSLLEKSETPFELIFEGGLRKYPDLKFQNAYPKFKGKTFSQIADIIQKDPNVGTEFKLEMLDQMIAYTVQINL